MTFLLIAGSGYLGQQIFRQFYEHKKTTSARAQAIALHDEELSTSSGCTLRQKCCDFSSAEQLQIYARTLAQAPDVIIHSASSGRGGTEAYRKVFIQGTQNLLNLFPETHLLLTSSSSVYHQTNGERVDEKSLTQPLRESSQVLLEAEELVLAHSGTVTRLAGLYGPGRCHPLKQVREGTAIIETDGSRLLNHVHRDDAASALLHLANHPDLSRGQIFNLCDSKPISQLDLYQALCHRLGLPLPPSGERSTEQKRAWTNKVVSNLKLRESGWQPQYPSITDAFDSIF